MPGSIASVPETSDGPVPAWREGGQPLRGRLPKPGSLHQRDPATGAWVEADDLTQVDVAVESDDEFAAIERDAKAQIAALQADRRRLSLDAISDVKIAAECADIESRLRAAEQELERVGLARQEALRREANRLAQEDEQRRMAARVAASKLLSRRAEVMRRFDEAASEFAQALQESEALSVEADLKLQEAGERPGAGMLGPKAYENALRAHLASAGVSGRCIAFEGAAPGHLAPLTPEPAES